MRAAVLAVTVLAFAASARADTVTTIGATFDARATGATFDAAANAGVSILGGARIAMSFEAPPLATPPPESHVADVKLAPELLAGALVDSVHAEGFVGGGLRLDLRMVGHRTETVARGGIYFAGRAILIGGHQDGAVELVIGSYITYNARGARVGWEGGAMMRPRHDTPTDQAKELDAVITMYVGR
jgi:hypothetical protein